MVSSNLFGPTISLFCTTVLFWDAVVLHAIILVCKFVSRALPFLLSLILFSLS
jgi:hypothetical protein